MPVNEPIFFYTGGSRAALELVVNKSKSRRLLPILERAGKFCRGTASARRRYFRSLTPFDQSALPSEERVTSKRGLVRGLFFLLRSFSSSIPLALRAPPFCCAQEFPLRCLFYP